MTASRAIIAIDELSRKDLSKVKQKKKLLTLAIEAIEFFFDNGVIYQLYTEQGPAFTKRILFSIFSIIKLFSAIDEKHQLELYCRAEEKGIQNLLVADNIIDKNSMHMCLTILLKLSG